MSVMNSKLRLSDRVAELTRKNCEYSKMIQRLLKTIEEERFIHERQLRTMQSQCRKDRLDLIAKTVEIERQLKELLDKNDCKNFQDAANLINGLEMRLLKANTEIEKMNKSMKDMSAERDDLRNANELFQGIMKEQQNTTHNFKLILETEVAELRNRLRCAEHKNLELIQRNMQQIRSLSQAVVEVVGNSEGDGRSDACINSNREICEISPTSGNSRFLPRIEAPSSCRSIVFESTSELEATSDEIEAPTSRVPLHTRRTDGCSYIEDSNRNYPREIICLILSVLLFALSFFIRSNDSDCKYFSQPYSAPITSTHHSYQPQTTI